MATASEAYSQRREESQIAIACHAKRTSSIWAQREEEEEHALRQELTLKEDEGRWPQCLELTMWAAENSPDSEACINTVEASP